MIEWLREHNLKLETENRVGFYGMDVYDEWRSKQAVLETLQQVNPTMYRQVNELYACFAPFAGDSWSYARSVQLGLADCSAPAARVVELIKEHLGETDDITEYDYFYLLQNAYVKKNAEKFFRESVLVQNEPAAWNSRANHMHQTVLRLLALYGDQSRGIVWAHNTHIGDARFTEMRNFNQQNIGQLSREHLGAENVFAVGFTTYRGRVKAAGGWGERRREMRIAPAQPNSIEWLMNQTGKERFYLVFDHVDRSHEEFIKPLGHRAVGVVFNPNNEPRQYMISIIPYRYDAFIFFRETRALHPF
jgi:erythromycin esterase